MADLEPQPVDPVAQSSGSFQESALGFEVGYRYRVSGDRSRWFVGGEFMVFAGGEYTFPIVGETIRGVVFLDTGTVESKYGIQDYRASFGFGVRIHVPFFGDVPMSLDFGFPLSKTGDDDTQLLSFSFGWVF